VARTNESSYSESIFAWDGVGFHRVTTPVLSSTTANITMLFYDALNNRLWYHVDTSTAVQTTSYIQFNSNSTFPYASFPTTGTHALYTSRIHAGYRRIPKSAVRLLVDARNIRIGSGTAPVTSIVVDYSLDGSTSWVRWGTVKMDGVTEFRSPGGLNSVEFNDIQLRFTLSTASSAQTPVLEGWVLMGMLRPATAWGYSFNVLITDKRAKQQLRNARNSTAPIHLITLLNEDVYGYITSLNETQVEPSAESKSEMEAIVRINFVETVNSGVAGTTYPEIPPPPPGPDDELTGRGKS
jgi:hypothetical protein